MNKGGIFEHKRKDFVLVGHANSSKVSEPVKRGFDLSKYNSYFCACFSHICYLTLWPFDAIKETKVLCTCILCVTNRLWLLLNIYGVKIHMLTLMLKMLYQRWTKGGTWRRAYVDLEKREVVRKWHVLPLGRLTDTFANANLAQRRWHVWAANCHRTAYFRCEVELVGIRSLITRNKIFDRTTQPQCYFVILGKAFVDFIKRLNEFCSS